MLQTDITKNLDFIKDKMFLSGTCFSNNFMNSVSDLHVDKEFYKPDSPNEILPFLRASLKNEIIDPDTNELINESIEPELYKACTKKLNDAPHFGYFVQLYDKTENKIDDTHIIKAAVKNKKDFINYQNFYILDKEFVNNNEDYRYTIAKYFYDNPEEINFVFCDNNSDYISDSVDLSYSGDLIISCIKDIYPDFQYDFGSKTDREEYLIDSFPFFIDLYTIYKNAINRNLSVPTIKIKLVFTILSAYHLIF